MYLECTANGMPSEIPTLVGNVAKSMIDERTDLLLHTLTMRGGHVASLVKFCPVV